MLEYSFRFQGLFGLKPRYLHHREDLEGTDQDERERRVRLNAMRSDAYITFFVVFELAALWFAIGYDTLWRFESWPILVVILLWYRIGDIVQNIVNRLVFSPLRGSGQHRLASGVRTLLLTVIAYFELIVCFALIDLRALEHLCSTSRIIQPSDALYFSAISQLTIGYGDIVPTGPLRFVAVSQGILGFFFAAIIIARLVSVLPRVSGDLERLQESTVDELA